ncbi:hypothetical protein ACF0H5_018973 [Mactra antiquata]
MEESSHGSMTVSDLPHDIVLYIFQFISKKDLLFNVRNTCSLWNQLSRQKKFWKTLDIKDFSNYVFPTKLFLNLLADIQDSVEVLVFNLNHHDLQAILHDQIECTNLKEIRFESTSSLTCGEELKTAVSVFSIKYPDLQKLSVISYVSESEDVFPLLNSFTFSGEDRSLMNWKQFYILHPHLTEITFQNCELEADVLIHILTQYPGLRKLDITHCQCSYSEIYEYLKSGEITPPLTMLQYLNISNTDISDALLEEITKQSSMLKLIDITSCSRLTNTGIEAVARQCPDIKTLIINVNEFGHSDVSFSGAQSVAEHCKCLEVLKLNYCPEVGDEGVKCLANSCFNLKVLEIAGCLSLLDSTVATLTETCKYIQKLKFSGCSKLTSKSLSTVLTRCKHLKYLNIESCHRVADLDLQELGSDEQLVTYAKNQPNVGDKKVLGYFESDVNAFALHSHVSTLIMRFCSNVSNNCMKKVAQFCPDLQKLDIQACYLVTNAGIREVLKQCKYLKHLNISGGSVSQTSRINNDCLLDVVKHGHNLQELRIVENYNITVDGVMPIVQECKNMVSVCVGIGKRTNISKEGLIDMSAKIENKTICLQFKLHAEILIYDNVELSLKRS